MFDMFTRKKRSILEKLAVPDNEYKDRSVKGAIDEPISDLIEEINALDGLVTTSSCSGRISVFLEGEPYVGQKGYDDTNDREDGNRKATAHAPENTKKTRKKGGRWMYMNHAPLDVQNASSTSSSSHFHDLFGMKLAQHGSGDEPELSLKSTRFVHFKFEPMILHILTASKEYAHTILAAAQKSGFRESGATSLPKSGEPHLQSVMVAVRSSGLLLDSIIGYCQEIAEDNSTSEASPEINSLVDESYLRMLVKLSNERFIENAERMNRFRKALQNGSENGRTEKSNGDKARNRKDKRDRKYAEGMKIQDRVREERSYKSHYKDNDDEIDGLGWILR